MSHAPHPFDVEIGDGHGYMLDLKRLGDWRHEPIPLLRPGFVEADTLGEKIINPEGLWRFSDRDWSHGAGQRRADMPDSDTARFWRSRGVDVWTKWQVSLLPTLTAGSVSTGNRIFMVGGSLYLSGTGGVRFGYPNFTDVVDAGSGFPACTDGDLIYYIDSGSGKIYKATVGVAGAGTVYNNVTSTSQLYYVAGRLIAVGGSGNILDVQADPDYDDLGELPGGFTSVDMTAGTQAIYVAAINGDRGLSQVFAITIKDDGTGLNPPVAVTPPFDGTLRRVLYYEGLVFLGQEEGVRMCQPSSDGLALTIGPLINPGLGRSVPGSGNCSALAGHNGMVWFGIDMYELDDSGTTYWAGLGRINPQVINDDGAPAWAADVMASGFSFSSNPAVLDVAFSADGNLLYLLTTTGFYVAFFGNNVAGATLASEGYIDSGLISYDIPDNKTAHYLTVRTDADSAGDITPSIAVDGSTSFTDLDVVPAGTLVQKDTISGLDAAGFFEIRETLARGTDVHDGPILTRHMLEADPVVDTGSYLYVPVLLAETVDLGNSGGVRRVDVTAERNYLEGLRDSGEAVTYRELTTDYTVTVEEVVWLPTHITADRKGANATCLLKLKTV